MINDIETLQPGGTGSIVDPDDRIESNQSDFQRGVFEMPSVAEFEESV
ncbi:hypothetical protein ACFQJ7_13890 [Halovenus rubra]|uniref:Uncharacterized protein n=2 Tax=Halovenus rubra TaxID=869890 RepID=A0ABD5XBG1_9EURY|nr:hypothetical protein [Halovenus rubra]